jgi:CheY-like chemotaxis protein
MASDVPLWLSGDPVRTRQVVVNLLGNSLKFTDRGQLSIRVGCNPQGKGPTSLLFSVSDTGVGIPKEKLHTIFESFVQADSSTARRYGGTGLGLAICKRLVDAMGGRIWAESAVGQGSTFYFTAEFGLAAAPAKQSQAAPNRFGVDSTSFRILVADDSEDNQAIIRAYLGKLPYVLDFVHDGASALKQLISGRYNLALVDVHMPVMDGYAVVRGLREHEHAHGIDPLPVVALTADAFKDAVAQSLAAGFTMHLAKPIRRSTLVEAISNFVDGRHPVASEAPSQQPCSVVVDEELSAILEKFISNVRQNSSAIATALTRGDFATVRLLGHNLKGTGSSFGLPQISQLGAELERAAEQQSSELVRKLNTQLIDLLNSSDVHQSCANSG